MLSLKESTMLGEIPGCWETKILAELLREHYPGDWGQERGVRAVKVIRSTNLTREGRLDFKDVAVRALSPLKASMLTPKFGDILLERSGGGPGQPVGRVGFVERDLPGHAFSNFLHLLRPKSEEVNPRFLGWILHQINQTGRVVRLEQQTTQMRNLNFRDYLTMQLPYPPICEQAAIARVLDAVDTAIERTREAVKRARACEQSVLEEAFSNLAAEPRRLGEFTVNVRYGTSKASNDKSLGNAVLRIPNVVGNRLALDDVVYVDLPSSEVERLRLDDGDLLLVRTNGNPSYVGRSVVFRRPDARVWLYASYLIRVRMQKELLPDFVNVFLGLERGRRELLRRVTTSAGNHNINSNSIRLIQLPVPLSWDMQAEIVELARRFRLLIDSLEAKARALSNLKRSLMHDLLTGRIRVRSVDEAPSS